METMNNATDNDFDATHHASPSVEETDPPEFCDSCKEDTKPWNTKYYRGSTLTKTLCIKCDRNLRLSNYVEDGVLTTRLISDAIMWHHSPTLDQKDSDAALMGEIAQAEEKIQKEITRFEYEVWFAGVQDFARNSKFKGSSFKTDDLEILCFTMCARAVLQISHKLFPTATIGVITAEDEAPRPVDEVAARGRGCMGLHGISATEEQALFLLASARRAWKARDKSGHKLVTNRDVTLLY